MEKNETVLPEFNSSMDGIGSLVSSSREQMESLYNSINDEIEYLAPLLDELKQEIADNKTCIGKMVDQEAQNASQQGEKTEDDELSSVVEFQVRLAVAREQEKYLQEKYADLEMRLGNLAEKRDRTEQMVSQMKMLAGEFNQMLETVDKIQNLVQNQNFGIKIITAQEEERRRVAREIHDGPAQAMANVIFLAEVCEKLIELDSARAKRELHELRQQVRGCLEETRKIIFDLRPMALDDLGLVPTVKRIADILRERTGIKVSVKTTGAHSQQLDARIEVSLFRIIQESMNNIEKHSDATEAQVVIDFQNEDVTATIADNGKGFEPKRTHNESNSFGLVGMRERVNLLNGKLDISSQKGGGTQITARIPLIPTPATERKRLA